MQSVIAPWASIFPSRGSDVDTAMPEKLDQIHSLLGDGRNCWRVSDKGIE